MKLVPKYLELIKKFYQKEPKLIMPEQIEVYLTNHLGKEKDHKQYFDICHHFIKQLQN